MTFSRTLTIIDPDSKEKILCMWQTSNYCWIVFCVNDELRKEIDEYIEHGHFTWVLRPGGYGKDDRIPQRTRHLDSEFLKRIGDDLKNQFKFDFLLSEQGTA